MWIPRAKETCGQANFSHHRKQLLYSNRWRSYIREPCGSNPLECFRISKISWEKMVSALVFYPQNTFFNKPSCVSFSKQLKLWHPFYSLIDGSLAFASHNGVLQFRVSSTKSDGSSRGRPPRKSSASGRTEKEDEDSKSQSSVRKQLMSSNQEEIMALFRRIQSSISEGESTDTKKKKASRSEKSPTNSILEVLRHSRKHSKGPSTVREGKKVLTQEQSVPRGPEDASRTCLG
ncbi:hypothetical protein OIU77_009283 [Salix suchowensis]|uniref:Uncharacterized protein n=1 Tax=Salix suchowensis TaxID=1278906 RepID=A0ABQ9AET6_9ROSI|nr:hypothetical protein OIU77_009283 [Salix suchowensis]